MADALNINSIAPGRQVLDPGLERTRALLKALDNPDTRFPIVHVAGTNGKGSVCATLGACLRAAGARCGVFVSPFLLEPRDAVTVNGAPLSVDEWRVCVDAAIHAGIANATTFELWTASAFLAFLRAGVDVAVIEVGVGGALDATTAAAPPAVAVITSIALDHVALLGGTLESIAAHKAGIIRGPNTRAVVSAAQQPEVRAVCVATAAAVGARLVIAPVLTWAEPARPRQRSTDRIALCPSTNFRVPMKLLGDFQLENGALALAALTELAAWVAESVNVHSAVPPAALQRLMHATQRLTLPMPDASTPPALVTGFSSVSWRGRMQRLRMRTWEPDFEGPWLDALVDGGHNEAALAAVRLALQAELDAVDREGASTTPASLVVIYAGTASRDARACLSTLRLRAGSDTLIAVPFDVPEGMPWAVSHTPDAVAAAARDACPGVDVRTATTLSDAVRIVAADPKLSSVHSVVSVLGSLYLVAEVFRQLQIDEQVHTTLVD